jgi:hypothetical protein
MGSGKRLPDDAVAAVIDVTIDEDATRTRREHLHDRLAGSEPRPESSANKAELGFISATR